MAYVDPIPIWGARGVGPVIRFLPSWSPSAHSPIDPRNANAMLCNSCEYIFDKNDFLDFGTLWPRFRIVRDLASALRNPLFGFMKMIRKFLIILADLSSVVHCLQAFVQT